LLNAADAEALLLGSDTVDITVDPDTQTHACKANSMLLSSAQNGAVRRRYTRLDAASELQ